MVTAADLEVLLAAVATPYDADGNLDRPLLERLIEDGLSRGVEGVYCCGSSGEGLLLTPDERTAVVETAVLTAGGAVPVVAHVGALSTDEAIELARRAQGVGASAVSMIPPIYYSYGLPAVIDHYRAVMDAIDLPMIVYNIPQFTGQEFDADSAAELLSDPRVIGVKQTAHSMFALERMRAAFPEKAFINGFDETFVASIAAGARGAIGTTVGLQIELFLAARAALRAGDLLGAQVLQQRINDVIAELVAIDVFPAAKYLSGHGIGDLGPCRRPFMRLSAESRERLDRLEEVVQAGIAYARSVSVS